MDGSLTLKEGEYVQQNTNSIVISDLMAEELGISVGDKIPLSLHYSSSGLGISDYLKSSQFASTGEYLVTGIFEKQEETKADIYMGMKDWMKQSFSSQDFVRFLIKNSSAEQFQKEIQTYLSPEMKLFIEDQGYTEAIKPVRSYNRVLKLFC